MGRRSYPYARNGHYRSDYGNRNRYFRNDTNTAHGDYASAGDLVVNWDAFTQAPDAINVSVDSAYSSAGTDYAFDLTSMTVVNHTIPGGTGARLLMNVANIKVLTGSRFEGTSSISAMVLGESEVFSTAP